MTSRRCLLACVAAALVLGGCGGGSAQRAATAARSTCPPAMAPRLVERVSVGSGVVALAVSGETLWAARPAAGEVIPIGIVHGRVGAAPALRIGGAPISLAAGFGALYVADRDRGRVLRISERTRTIVRRIAIETPIKVVVSGGQIAVISLDDGELTPLDPYTFGAFPALAIPAIVPADAAFDGAELWILGAADHSLTPYDVGRAGFVREGLRLPTRVVGAVTAGQGAVWVALPTAHGVARLEPATRVVTVLRASRGFSPTAIAVGDCAIWVGDRDGRVQRLDAASGKPVGRPLRIGRSLAALAVDRDGVWASDPRGGTVVRVG
jgi:hypothetical protein